MRPYSCAERNNRRRVVDLRWVHRNFCGYRPTNMDMELIVITVVIVWAAVAGVVASMCVAAARGETRIAPTADHADRAERLGRRRLASVNMPRRGACAQRRRTITSA